jgi:hypothetical protein
MAGTAALRDFNPGYVAFGSNSDVDTRNWDVGFTPMSGHRQPGRSGPKSADIVAKVFLGWRTKILRAADAFYTRRREGPYRFIQNRSRTSVVALKSDAAVEKSKDQLSRDFPRRSIFDFCNNICQ